MCQVYSESIFMDSGAHSLYNLEVLKHGQRKGKNGKVLDKPPVKWSQGDFSYYSLEKGSNFRAYCDAYADFIRVMQPKGVICANVDVISNPEKTWEVQQYFEQEHGVCPVPIVHYGTPMKYVDRYLEATGGPCIGEEDIVDHPPRYTLLGVGGLGQGVSRHEYFSWADEFFLHICPESNGYKPVIRTHGFAMTSWELMCRYPWWSVDSATWIKLSAYGWLYVPRWSHEREDWRWDRLPLNVSVSAVSPERMVNGKHYEYGKAAPAIRETVDHWLAHVGVPMGSMERCKNEKGEWTWVMKEYGVASHHRARCVANLHYLKALEQSRPPWPYPLDRQIIAQHGVRYRRKGLGVRL